jgi:hypothetical protein
MLKKLIPSLVLNKLEKEKGKKEKKKKKKKLLRYVTLFFLIL